MKKGTKTSSWNAHNFPAMAFKKVVVPPYRPKVLKEEHGSSSQKGRTNMVKKWQIQIEYELTWLTETNRNKQTMIRSLFETICYRIILQLN